MDNVNFSLTNILRDVCFTNKSEIIENLGYIKDDELSNKNVTVYVDTRIQSVVVILPGADLEKYYRDNTFMNIINIFNVLNYLKEKNNSYEKCIEEVIKKYSEYTIIFLGHSLGGLIINLKLQNTKYNCYVYNPFFVNKEASENIRNYRTNIDILSLGLIGKKNETVDLNFLDGLVKYNFDIFKFLLDSHETTIFNIYPDKSIFIPIQVYKA